MNAIQLVPTTDRAAVGATLRAAGLIDLIVPRWQVAGRACRKPRSVLAHLDGITNTAYVHASADPDMARELVVNAKMRRTGICGATETVLLDAVCILRVARPRCSMPDARYAAMPPMQALDPRVTPRTRRLGYRIS